MSVLRLSREQARRIAVRAQLLDADRPTELVEMVRRLTLLQIDPTAAIAPSADLVAWSRLGSAYRPEHLTHAVEHDRGLFELDALVRPMSDLGLVLAGAVEWPQWQRMRAWLDANDAFRRDILDLLRDHGPVQSRAVPDTASEPWTSTGWTHGRNVTRMLEAMMMRGEVAISGRVGRERLWDLPERVYPSGVEVPSPEDALQTRNLRRLQALGIARRRTTAMPLEPIDVGDTGVVAEVEGVKGQWQVDPQAVERADEELAGRTALLSPFDRLVYDRQRALELFDFEFTLEMYKPAEKRRWGYFALPVLHGDRLVGKVDAKADRTASVLRVFAIHQDVRFTRAITMAVHAELDDLAGWLGLGRVDLPTRQTVPATRTSAAVTVRSGPGASRRPGGAGPPR
ncbi:MAG TPA: crosslink repair DNA glycosylase YcaQ family protein [Marmoricola sp.]|nr:crosslink repair DNA glycosylase YcaQ family protein [Marmoricola sp.]